MFVHRIEVRFRDCDSLGHVNNSVYLTYLEQTRIAHWRSLWNFGDAALSADMPGVILARVECDYKRPIKWGDVVDVRMRVTDVGRTSFRYEYEVVDQQARIVAVAKTVQVMYDYRAERPVPVPDRIRALLLRGPEPAGPA